VTQVSVIDLFAAGVVPGLMLAAAISIVIFLQGLKGELPRSSFKLATGEGRRLVIEGLLILTLPVVIIRGASSGVFTTTEAGGVACLYALLLGFFVFRQLTPRAVWSSPRRS
jgi:TRAP-type C4-dicarboxylate transport system permease large subunit